MDNLTHTLIGTLLGETTARTTAPDPHGLPAAVRRNLLVTFAAIGSNLPDIDVAYSFLGGKVNNLLHHRGHSHTVLGTLLLTGIMLLIAQLWLRRRGLIPSRQDQLLLLAVAVVMPLLHIGMDFTNNYGVHPFWPFYNGWLYGDAVFIAEPLLWAACAPLVFLLRTHTARTIAAVLVTTALVLLIFVADMVPPGVAVGFASLLAAMLFIGYRAPPRTALIAGIALWIGVTLTFIASSGVAGRQIDALAARNFPNAQLLDRVLTPMPANPLCWQALLIQQEDDKIALRRAMLSLAPTLIAADRCNPSSLPATAPLEPIGLPGDAATVWYDQVVTPRNELAALARTNCEVAAVLRFMRAPWFAHVDGKSVLGDRRYDRETGLGFAEIEVLDPPAHCPRFVPRWIPPRADILGESSGDPASAKQTARKPG